MGQSRGEKGHRKQHSRAPAPSCAFNDEKEKESVQSIQGCRQQSELARSRVLLLVVRGSYFQIPRAG